MFERVTGHAMGVCAANLIGMWQKRDYGRLKEFGPSVLPSRAEADGIMD